MSLLVLSSTDVDKATGALTPTALLTLSARVFSSFSSDDPASASSSIHQPPRLSLPTAHHTALFMPARVPPFGTATKIVCVPQPGAPEAVRAGGLPASTVVMDEVSGGVRAVVNARKLTALRNAAGSLLSTTLVAPLKPPSWPNTIVAIGAGAQVAAHLRLFLTALPSLSTCTIFNRTPNARLHALVSVLSSEFADRTPTLNLTSGVLPGIAALEEGARGGEEWASEDARRFRESIRGADIIVCATSSHVPLVHSVNVKSGAHLCLIGSYTPEMHEVNTALLKRARVVIVDSKEACLHEAGELIAAKLTADELIELGTLVDVDDTSLSWEPRAEEIQRLRERAGDVTVFKSVGLGVQDVAIACKVVEHAEKEGLGTRIAFDE